MVTLGSGANRKTEDWHLSRYACYLIVQNADPNKPIVALGQTYFAVQTRRAELADELAALPEDQRRLIYRSQTATALRGGRAMMNETKLLQQPANHYKQPLACHPE